MKRIAALILLASLSANALAFEPFVVSDIRIDGLTRIAQGTVLSYLPIEKGETLSDDKAQAAIRALYQTKFFSDVELDRQGDILVIKVVERPAIAKPHAARQQGHQGRRPAQGPEGDRPGRRRNLRPPVARSRPARTHPPVLQPRQVQRLGRSARHAPRSQPRRHRYRNPRRQGGEDQGDQRRRQQGIPGQGDPRRFRIEHHELAVLVLEGRPVLA